MPREHEWDARWWSPIINAEHLRMREAAGVIDLSAFCVVRHRGAGCPRVRPAHLRGAVRRRGRQGDLHPGARRGRRLPLRPHRDAAGRRHVPGGHRRRARHGGPAVVHRPPGRRRRHDADRPHGRGLHHRALGAARPRHPRLAHPRRRLRRRLRVPHLPGDPGQGHADARVADLVRRRARLGAVRPDGLRRRPVGDPAGGGRRPRRRTRRHRRLRHHRPDREGLPRLRLRARRRAQHRRGRHAAAEGEGGRLHRQGGLPPAARGSPRRPCSAP